MSWTAGGPYLQPNIVKLANREASYRFTGEDFATTVAVAQGNRVPLLQAAKTPRKSVTNNVVVTRTDEDLVAEAGVVPHAPVGLSRWAAVVLPVDAVATLIAVTKEELGGL